MKNSLTRLLQLHRAKRYSKALQNQASTEQQFMLPGLPSPWNDKNQLTPAFQEELKAKLLALIQSPDDCILSDNAFSQLTLVACIFVKQDFPA